MKIFLVLISENDWERDQPDFDSSMIQSYEILSSELSKRDILLYRADYRWFNGELFTKGWKYIDGKWTKLEENIAPDVIFDKTSPYINGEQLNVDLLKQRVVIAHKYKMINPPEFTTLISNKLYQSIVFQDCIPKTVTSIQDISLLKTKKVVIKKFLGASAKYVNIINKDELKELGNYTLAQEFVDGRDENNMLRDFRFVFVDQLIAFGETRQAAIGSDYTNCSKGGFNTIYNIEEMDTELVKVANNIAQKLSIFKGVTYCIDLMIDYKTNKKFLIEVNSKPGLGLFKDKKALSFDQKTKDIYRKYLSLLIDKSFC